MNAEQLAAWRLVACPLCGTLRLSESPCPRCGRPAVVPAPTHCPRLIVGGYWGEALVHRYTRAVLYRGRCYCDECEGELMREPSSIAIRRANQRAYAEALHDMATQTHRARCETDADIPF